MTTLDPHPDRLLPTDPQTRDIARRLYQSVADAGIYSPHGHVDAAMLRDNQPFGDPAELLITPDHYVLRLLHSAGVSLDDLGKAKRGIPSEAKGREIWRRLCERWQLFAGTPVRYWFDTQLAEVFGITQQPSAATADDLYDQLSNSLAQKEFLPRALFDRFKLKVLATTDDPADDLAAHRELAADPSFSGKVLPTWRADRYMNPHVAGWSTALDQLASTADQDTTSYAGLLAALRNRRAFFIENGGTATDTGVADAGAYPLDDQEAERIHAAGLDGSITEAEGVAYRRNLLYRFAEMSCDDGLVMQLHAGVIRNHHRPTFDDYGPDTGHDLPDVGGFTRPLTQLLNDFGTHPNLHLVLFTVDETVFSREIAPLAGFYPAVYAGAPWWFIDTPNAIGRYRAAVTDSVGFYKTSGFIDDTRAYCSIPARHDMSRRCDAAYLAQLVAEHQLSEDDAAAIAQDLVSTIPITTFRLPA